MFPYQPLSSSSISSRWKQHLMKCNCCPYSKPSSKLMKTKHRGNYHKSIKTNELHKELLPAFISFVAVIWSGMSWWQLPQKRFLWKVRLMLRLSSHHQKNSCWKASLQRQLRHRPNVTLKVQEAYVTLGACARTPDQSPLIETAIYKMIIFVPSAKQVRPH